MQLSEFLIRFNDSSSLWSCLIYRMKIPLNRRASRFYPVSELNTNYTARVPSKGILYKCQRRDVEFFVAVYTYNEYIKLWHFCGPGIACTSKWFIYILLFWSKISGKSGMANINVLDIYCLPLFYHEDNNKMIHILCLTSTIPGSLDRPCPSFIFRTWRSHLPIPST